MIEKIYILWLREIKKYLRSKPRIIGSLGSPLLYLLVLGFGLNSFLDVGDVSYINFIFPGIIAMSVLFSAMFSGISVIWDKQFGFLKEILVAPIPRFMVMLGKTLGGATAAVIQGLLVFIIALIIGVEVQGFFGVFIAILFMGLIGMTFTALGICFASRMDDMNAFPLVINFVMMPLFFLSGALFPLEGVPKALKIAALLDPLTYGVDALRYGFIGVSTFPLWLDFTVLAVTFCIVLSIGSYLFSTADV
jgi:ABC-2 type transport system permease protein